MPGLLGQGEKAKTHKSRFVVLESDGVRLKHYPVTEVSGYKDGLVLRYKNINGLVDLVYAGRNYRPLEESGQFFVGKNLGNNSAAALVEDTDGKEMAVAVPVVGDSTDADCPGEDLSALARSDLLAVAARTLYGKAPIPWKLIIIVGVVIAVAVVIAKIAGVI